MLKKIYFSLLIIFAFCSIEAKLPELTPQKTVKISEEILKLHASQNTISAELMGKIFQNYLEELDPMKTYFIKSDIIQWLEPSPELLKTCVSSFKAGDFHVFNDMYDTMVSAIEARHKLEENILLENLPKRVNVEEFKNMDWVSTREDLFDRLLKIRALQIKTTAQLNEELKEISLKRIAKRQLKNEEKILNSDPDHRTKIMLTKVLKATASALDTHTAYLTPDEAKQFMIDVQQRLYGIGAQLRDDINGLSVVKIVEGGPAYRGKELKAGDRIIAVGGEPVVGMSIEDAVELIRGEENSIAALTVIREEKNEEGQNKETKLDISIIRGEVVLKEARYESSYEPYGDGVIAYLRLYTFYQDPESCSASDLQRELEKLKREHKVKGVVLDLRYNTGGLLSQAVEVTGLFITKGIVASIKDNTGTIQHLRALDGRTIWNGPLLVLVNRASASASEIVAQTLQDYGRALIVGDDNTYGKGSFQTFTLNQSGEVNPDGEYKVSRGRYYTVSGKTPQLSGVSSDIVIPGPLSEIEIGEKFATNPLEGDCIKANYDDDLSDVPYLQRDRMRSLYRFNLQPRLTRYTQYNHLLSINSTYRIEHNKNYQSFIKELKKKRKDLEEDSEEEFGQNDLQLTEANNIMKDLILLDETSPKTLAKKN